jgi:hypothetical protein
VVWLFFFFEERKTSIPLFSSLLVSLAGKGRECVFGWMVWENQFADRVVEDIRRKVWERWLWQCVKVKGVVVDTVRGPEFLCRPLVGSSRGPCPQFPRHSVFKLQAFGACVLGSRETRYFSKLKPVTQERCAPKPHHAPFPPILQPTSNFSLFLLLSLLFICVRWKILCLSLWGLCAGQTKRFTQHWWSKGKKRSASKIRYKMFSYYYFTI